MWNRYLLVGLLTVGGGWLAVESIELRGINGRSLEDAVERSVRQSNLPDGYSNILPDDYVGAETCGKCHQEQYQLWYQHPHRKMNQMPSPETVMANFRDAMLRLPSGSVEFTTAAEGTYVMTVTKDGQPFRRYDVTRVVGSRVSQFFIGKQTCGPEPSDHDIYGEHMLPFAYWLQSKQWFPRKYFDQEGEEQAVDGVPLVEAVNCDPEVRPYAKVCMHCHNTFPHVYRLNASPFKSLLGCRIGVAADALQTELGDSMEIASEDDPLHSLIANLDPDQHMVNMGISCEACHYGGREHAKHSRDIRFLPTSPVTKFVQNPHAPQATDERHNATTVLTICFQCHSGSGASYPNHASKSNSREAIDMAHGACSSQLRCVDCHDPHTAGPKSSGGPDNPRFLAQCVRCHTKYQRPDAVAAHTHHSAASGVNCLDCHMPRYTQGLNTLVRTHRISQPVESEMVAAGAVNACNLCHLDQSMRWTLDQLSNNWGVQIETDPSAALQKTLTQPAGELWLNSDDPALRLVASESYARSRFAREKMATVVRSMNDPQALNRVFAGFSTRHMMGLAPDADLPVDLTASPSERSVQIENLLRDYLASDSNVDR